ncbi:cell wall glucanase [Neohortaea acidophila]|uniref:chitinase n=1 Tax=Neohortaea acidophila TaxID=245834 RepID=A0A6A6PMY7_9PEZI|nr:cell wall glucanase [Neohortaea acidophila]KAF2481460.1 cell wall glucanase [Neohortaea acidophila]
MSRLAARLALGLCLATHVAAQTSTSCNPLHKTCPADPALGTTFDTTFNESTTQFDPSLFKVVAGEDLISFTSEGAELTISEQGQSVTVQTAFYVFFGQIEVLFKAATGQGIISTFNMLSDDLDEIDVEIMGGNTSYTSTNFYGWGNTSQFNTLYIPSTGGSWGTQGAMGAIHNYTVNWTPQSLQWIFDGQVVRTVANEPAGQWPQTPSYMKFGIWAGGDPSNPPGTIKWAGGETDYSKGPFTMTVQSIRMIDGHQNASSYTYGGNSGSWQSIDVAAGESAAYKAINHKQTTAIQNAEQKWNGLSTTAKIGIAAGVGGGFVIALIAFVFYCIKQRRAGRREKALADQEWEKQQSELVQYRHQMKRGYYAVSSSAPGRKF